MCIIFNEYDENKTPSHSCESGTSVSYPHFKQQVPCTKLLPRRLVVFSIEQRQRIKYFLHTHMKTDVAKLGSKRLECETSLLGPPTPQTAPEVPPEMNSKSQ